MSVSRDLAGARVVDVRSGGVLDRRRQPADDRVARVLGAPLRILVRRWRFPDDDGVAESRRLERGLPRLDALLDVGRPPGGGGRVDPVGDRRHRIGDLGVRVLLLQPPARDVAPVRRAVLVAAVVDLAHGEIADPLVEEPRLHRLLGQLHHAVVQQHGRAPGPHAAAPQQDLGPVLLVGRRRRRRIGVRGPDLDVRRKGRHVLDE